MAIPMGEHSQGTQLRPAGPSLPMLEARLRCCPLSGPWQAQWSAHCVPTLTHICPTLLGFPHGFANAERLIGPNSLICRALPPHLRPAGKHLLQEPSHHPIAELDSYSRPLAPPSCCS